MQSPWQAFVDARREEEGRCADFYDLSFEEAAATAKAIFAETDGLRSLSDAPRMLSRPGVLGVLRYMQRPSVSEDDFKSLSGIGAVTLARHSDEDNARQGLAYVKRTLNLKLFPWLAENRAPSKAELEKAGAAVAALVADQRTKTQMRNSPSRRQETTVRELLKSIGYREVPAREVLTPRDFPAEDEVFSREAKVGEARADVAFGLADGRVMLLECKVSNSEVNSYKRLNHEVTDKVVKWRRTFGESAVCGCILQGVFRPENLIAAQAEGVAIFWSNDLQPLIDFVRRTEKRR